MISVTEFQKEIGLLIVVKELSCMGGARWEVQDRREVWTGLRDPFSTISVLFDRLELAKSFAVQLNGCRDYRLGRTRVF